MTETQTRTQTRNAKPRTRRSDGTRDAIILVSVLFGLAGWGISIAIWGIPGLYIPALLLVPVIWVALILISRG